MVQASKILSLVALVGFAASLITHLAGYADIERPFGINPWPLHVGLFIVCFPAVLAAQKLSKDFSQSEFWTASLRGCPDWMHYSLLVLFGYAFLSFFVFLISGGSSPDNEASTIRGFSGHWLLFYFGAFAVLHSYSKLPELDPVRRCKNNHAVEPQNVYCTQCGDKVGRQY